MLSAGIVGLPNVGKSTLFNALTRTHKAPAANYPFCTIDPNVGIVTVPDQRLARLAEISDSQKIVATAIEFVDIAVLVKGASTGEGVGNQFLSHIREVDAIVQVVFFSSRRRDTRFDCDWSSDVCSSDLSQSNLRGKINGGGAMLTVRTGDGSIRLEQL